MSISKLPKIKGSAWEENGIIPEEYRSFIAQIMSMYGVFRAAIREMSTRLEILDDEFQLLHSRNPIHHMQSRLKAPQSILAKLERRGHPKTVESALANLYDIAGVRVICSYIDDVYELAHRIERQDDIQIVRKSDYIQNPKENGYRSLHLVVNLPVYLSDGKHCTPVEVQIRTIAMDFWASLEHDLKYKSGGDVDPQIAKELMECGEAIASVDKRMQSIAQMAEKLAIQREGDVVFPPRAAWIAR